MDLIILLILILIIVLFFKDFKSVVYLLGILETFFRLIHKIASKLQIPGFTTFVKDYIPSSLSSVLAKYSNGLLFEVLEWGLIILFIFFLIYLIKYFIKKKK